MNKTRICLVMSVILLAIMTSIVSANNGGSASIVAQDNFGWAQSERIKNALESAGFDVMRKQKQTASQIIDLCRPRDTVHVFFFVGHGNRLGIGGMDKLVTAKELKNALNCGESTTILILDSCESGGAAKEAGDACCTILTATNASEGSSGTGQASFTVRLANALEGEADKAPYGNGDKEITLEEVRKYLLKEYDTDIWHHVYNGEQKGTGDVVLSRIANFKLISPAEQKIEAGKKATFEFELKNNFDMEKTVEVSANWKQVKERGIVRLPPQWWGATIDGHGVPDEGVSFNVELEPNETKKIKMVVSSSQAHELGDFAKIEVSDPDGTITTSILTTTTIIPEFPTMVLPVVVILGLMSLLFRRN
ncbi:MAG: hypothetical protein KAR20_13695 [Candidatus Heimdallarchaeota archaeon]|nr:hypothetical protein [Candidatus Heimdallarchaeota archaeon]